MLIHFDRTKANILLVDDDAARLLACENLLAELSQNLVRATSAHEALAWLMKEEFAVVLLDAALPDMDGFELARRIREHPRLAQTPIILVTDGPLTDAHARGLIVADYVQRPWVREILLGKVAVFVELQGQRHALRQLDEDLSRVRAQQALGAERHEAVVGELERSQQAQRASIAQLTAANAVLQRELSERDQALQEAEQHRHVFLAMLAHELRNPLAPIHNAVQLLRRQPSQVDWSCEVIERQLAQMTRLIDDLLDVSRITRGRIQVRRERIDLAPLVDRAREVVQPLLDERGHQLTVELPRSPLLVLGDPDRLTQVVANLLSNAALYTDRGGRISIAGAAVGRQIELRVRDNGIGIRADQLPLLFGWFTQIKVPGRTQNGLGIGLALSRRLLQMHGGSVTAYSEGPGKGSEFVISLSSYASAVAGPANLGRAEEAAADEVAMSNDDRTTTPRRVLVADDNGDTLESLAMLLQLEGHSVFTASDGQQTLERAEEHRPDIALLDIGMPGMDGYEVARRIRAQPWGRRITLVALTGWGQESDRSRSKDAGFDTHLVKPVDLDMLMQLLARAPTYPADSDAAPASSSARS